MLSRYLSKQKTAKGIIVLGQMNNYDKTFEMENRVYSKYGIAPTIRTYGGGNLQPKILVENFDNER